jgi:hypothetical protein
MILDAVFDFDNEIRAFETAENPAAPDRSKAG